MKLLNTLIALALALCATLAHPAEPDPPGVAGRLNYISGPVSFAPAQAKEDWSVAELNRPITTGDRLWTDSNGRAELHVGSLAMRMDAQTSLDVLVLDDSRLQLRLAQGTMNLRVRRLASDRLLEIATPGGAVVVKQPGTYRISVEPSGTPTMVIVRGGQAEVFTGNSSFLVRNNQQATIAGAKEDLFAAPQPDEFDRWAASRDQREDRVTSTRYVPEEMTGYEDLDEHGKWETVGEYGPVWTPSAVPAGWAPYRHGRWVWVAPWGWTWVDRAPWGFAPFHYGRWVHHGNRWAWAPGRRIARPVYAPALVAFVGGSNWSVSVGAGSALAVGWVPLGWREPYRPWYRASPAHFRHVNVTHVRNVTNITNVTNIRYRNRNAAGVTVVSRENFVSARAADRAALRVNAKTLASASVTRGTPVEAPARTSLAAAERGKQPPSAVRTRETVTVNTPPRAARQERQEARQDRKEARQASATGADESPSVRTINRAKRVELKQASAQSTGTPGAAAEAPSAADQRSPKAPKSQGSAGADSNKSARAQEKSKSQAADSNKSERAQDKAAPQAARRAPAPPPDVSQRQTIDRERRQSEPKVDTRAAEAKREQRQSERQERREKASAPTPQAPAVSSRQREDAAERAQQQRAQRQAQEQQAQQQARQRERAATQRAQEAQAPEPQRRRQPEAQQQPKEQAKERRQQQREQKEQRQRGD